MPPLSATPDPDLLVEVFDAIPALLLVVDGDVRIRHLNAASRSGLDLELDQVLGLRGGEALHCLNAGAAPGGCGHAPICADCAIRNAVKLAGQGNRTVRRTHRLVRTTGSGRTEMHLLVSASPLPGRDRAGVLLTLEDVSELARLRDLLPICMYCKKIRDDAGYWGEVTGYLRDHLEVEFTTSLCPDCKGRHFPEAALADLREGNA